MATRSVYPFPQTPLFHVTRLTPLQPCAGSTWAPEGNTLPWCRQCPLAADNATAAGVECRNGRVYTIRDGTWCPVPQAGSDGGLS